MATEPRTARSAMTKQILHAAQSKGARTANEDKPVNIHFALGVALLLGRPVLTAVGLYLAVTVVLR
jgi:hypothetical protein